MYRLRRNDGYTPDIPTTILNGLFTLAFRMFGRQGALSTRKSCLRVMPAQISETHFRVPCLISPGLVLFLFSLHEEENRHLAFEPCTNTHRDDSIPAMTPALLRISRFLARLKQAVTYQIKVKYK